MLCAPKGRARLPRTKGPSAFAGGPFSWGEAPGLHQRRAPENKHSRRPRFLASRLPSVRNGWKADISRGLPPCGSLSKNLGGPDPRLDLSFLSCSPAAPASAHRTSASTLSLPRSNWTVCATGSTSSDSTQQPLAETSRIITETDRPSGSTIVAPNDTGSRSSRAIQPGTRIIIPRGLTYGSGCKSNVAPWVRAFWWSVCPQWVESRH